MDSSKFLKYLEATYPERKDMKILNLKNITSGWETEIESFDLEWTSNDGTVSKGLVVRIFPGKGAAQKAEKEFRYMKELQNLKYPVPTVYIIETDDSIIGNPFIIMDRIEGGTIEDRIGLSVEKRDHWLDVMCELFLDLHNLEWESLATESERKLFEDPHYIVKRTISMYRELLEQTNCLVLLPVVEWLTKNAESVPCTKPSIIHGDFHPMNVLLDENDNPYVIDWGAARIHDSRADLAWSLLLYLAYGSKERRDDLLHRYESVLGKPVNQIEYFEVYACLRRLHDIYSSINEGLDGIGLRPEAVQMMKESVTHIINVRNRLEDLTGIVIPSIDAMIEELSQ